jgi:hypothetical protein
MVMSKPLIDEQWPVYIVSGLLIAGASMWFGGAVFLQALAFGGIGGIVCVGIYNLVTGRIHRDW